MEQPFKSFYMYLKKITQKIKLQFVFVMVVYTVGGSGCATHKVEIATGMLVGGLVGAGVGYQFVHHGENKEYEQDNTIISAIVFSLITGGALAWHYREVQEAKAELSGQYARYRLCDPENIQLGKELGQGFSALDDGEVYFFSDQQILESAIRLDDNTKWVYPTFRKRYLLPEREETQLLSKRYLWEIIRPGHFVTRSQDPQYFIQIEKLQIEPKESEESKNEEIE